MIRFTTVTGSVYEADEDRNRIRRLSGEHDPIPRQGPDGEWKEYEDLTQIMTGHVVMITWEYVDSVARTTITSPVQHVQVTKPETP